MEYHQNSTIAGGSFRGIAEFEDSDFDHSDFILAQQDALAELFWECILTTRDEMFFEDYRGNYNFHGQSLAAKTGVFDLSDYMESTAKIFNKRLPSLKFTAADVNGVTNCAKLALFQQSKLLFKDSRSGNLVCFGNLIAPITEPFDYYIYAESAFKTFCSFI